MMNLNVLIISQQPVWDLKGGAGKEVIFETLKSFLKHFNISIISPGVKPSILDPRSCYSINMEFQNRIDKIKYLGYLFNIFYPYYFAFRVRNIVKKERLRPDIIYTIGPWSAYAGNSAKTSESLIVNRYFGVAWKSEKFYTLREKLKFLPKLPFYRSFGDIAIMTNDGTKGDKFLTKIGFDKDKIHFLKNGFNRIEISSQEKLSSLRKELNLINNELLFLTVSRLAKWKRVDKAIELISNLRKDNLNVKLVVVGDGEELSNLRLLANKLGIGNSVLFVGSVLRENISTYYGISDIFLSLYEYSNAGNPLFEAMYHKKPIITLNNGDTSLFVDNTCSVLVEDLTSEKLLNAAKTLIFDLTLRKKISENAFEKFNVTFKNWDDRLDDEIRIILNAFDQNKTNFRAISH